MGLTIEKVHFGGAASHWNFASSQSMQFSRQENDLANKEFNIVKLRIYVNTMSEMIIPSSLVKAVNDEPSNFRLGIYSALSADFVRETLFRTDDGNNWNVIEPLYVNVSISYNHKFVPSLQHDLADN